MDLKLPEELILAVKDSIPGREIQIRQLTSLLSVCLAQSSHCTNTNLQQPVAGPSTLIVHGTEATGKSTITKAVLEYLKAPFATIRSQECITTRHLLERTIAAVKKACSLERSGNGALYAVDGKCDSLSAFFVLLQKIVCSVEKFTLVFDGIDRQRDASPTLLPAIARLGESVPLPVLISLARLTLADT